MIDEESWVVLDTDIKGDIYEGLLQKNAEDTKSGAGKYFTPRPLIKTMVECIRSKPNKTMADPTCGTGGFFLAFYNFISEHYKNSLDKEQKEFLRKKTFKGWDIVPNTVRLGLMNLVLHNIGELSSEDYPIVRADSLIADDDLKN